MEIAAEKVELYCSSKVKLLSPQERLSGSSLRKLLCSCTPALTEADGGA